MLDWSALSHNSVLQIAVVATMLLMRLRLQVSIPRRAVQRQRLPQERILYLEVKIFSPRICLKIGVVLCLSQLICFVSVHFRRSWHHRETNRADQSVLRKGADSRIWENCFNTCPRERLVNAYFSYAEGWRTCCGRYFNHLLFLSVSFALTAIHDIFG